MCLVLRRSSASFRFCACFWYLFHLLGVLLSSICFTVSVYCSARRVCVAAFVLQRWPTRLGSALAMVCHGNLGIARSSVLVFAFINRNCCRKANSVYTLRMEPRALCAGVGQCAFLWGPGRAPGGVCIMRAAHARRPSRRAASRGYCFPLSVRFVVTVHAKRA